MSREGEKVRWEGVGWDGNACSHSVNHRIPVRTTASGWVSLTVRLQHVHHGQEPQPQAHSLHGHCLLWVVGHSEMCQAMAGGALQGTAWGQRGRQGCCWGKATGQHR